MVGDATDPPIKGSFVIAHILSDTGKYGKGFAQAIATRYPGAKRKFQAWFEGDLSLTRSPFELGAVQWCAVGHELDRKASWDARWVANMVAQHGLRSQKNPHPLDLPALQKCLVELSTSKWPVVMPRIGCGLAGGSWEEVEPIIEACLSDLDVFVYDLK